MCCGSARRFTAVVERERARARERERKRTSARARERRARTRESSSDRENTAVSVEESVRRLSDKEVYRGGRGARSSKTRTKSYTNLTS